MNHASADTDPDDEPTQSDMLPEGSSSSSSAYDSVSEIGDDEMAALLRQLQEVSKNAPNRSPSGTVLLDVRSRDEFDKGCAIGYILAALYRCCLKLTLLPCFQACPHRHQHPCG